MASRQPTDRQLAYLDELKLRLRELRERQATFMVQTAQMLGGMSSSGLMEDATAQVATTAAPPSAKTNSQQHGSVVPECQDEAECECSGNIKQLIKRFEDLCKDSQQFHDLTMPEELINVDVRKLLKGYERLIEDGNVLQHSWFLLKKSTESCARLSQRDVLQLGKTSSKHSQISSSPEKSLQWGVAYRGAVPSVTQSLDSNGQANYRRRMKYNEEQVNWSGSTREYDCNDHVLWGPLLQLMWRLSPFQTCRRVKKRTRSCDCLPKKH